MSPFLTNSPFRHKSSASCGTRFLGIVVASFVTLLSGSYTGMATSVTLQGGFGYPNAKDSSGVPLAPGHKVSVGTFDTSDGFDPVASASDLPALLAHWRQFHFTTTENIDGEPGSFWLSHSSENGTNVEGFSFPGKKIYLLLTRTNSAYAEPAADGSNVLDFAIFSSDHSAWTFRSPPSDSNIPPADLSALNTSQITTAIAGIVDPSTGTFALASFSSGSDQGGSSSAFDQWLAATFGENSTHTADSVVGPSGLTALATFALNSSPEATAPPYDTVTSDDGRIGIEFTRKKSSTSGFTTHAQACQNLSSWDLPVNETIVSSTETTETVRAFPDFPEGTDNSKAFFRIRIEPAN